MYDNFEIRAYVIPDSETVIEEISRMLLDEHFRVDIHRFCQKAVVVGTRSLGRTEKDNENEPVP